MTHLAVASSSGASPLCGAREENPSMTDRLEQSDCPECLQRAGWEGVTSVHSSSPWNRVLSDLEDEELRKLDDVCRRAFDAWVESVHIERRLWLEFASWAIRGKSCPPDLLARYLQTVGQTVKLEGEQKAAMEALGKRVSALKAGTREAPSSANRDEPT